MKSMLGCATILSILCGITAIEAAHAANRKDLASTAFCSQGSANVRLRCLDRKILEMAKQLSMIKEGRSISVTTAEFQTYSKAEIDAKVNEARQLQLNEFIKYGDRVLISQNPEKCLHSGLFAGFGGCNVREAEVAGFQFEFHLNKPKP
jgi:hypothetical protein